MLWCYLKLLGQSFSARCAAHAACFWAPLRRHSLQVFNGYVAFCNNGTQDFTRLVVRLLHIPTRILSIDNVALRFHR
jgi:hypothetical protein